MTGNAPEQAVISIVIVTRNRAGTLRLTLEAISQLAIPDGLLPELIIVDNGSTDTTPDLIRAARADLPFACRCLHEPTPGVSGARNRALEDARGAITAMIDDDCLPARDWIASIWRHFQDDPDLDLVGGRIELHDQSQQPVTVLLSRQPKHLTRTADLRNFILGCNMAFRTERVLSLGGYDPRFGPGAILRSGDDFDLLYRAWRAGFRVLYAPDIVVTHNHGRTSRRQIRELERRYQFGRGAFLAKHLLAGRGEVLTILWLRLRPPVRAFFREPDRLRVAIRYLRRVSSVYMLPIGAVRYLMTRSPSP